MGKGLCGRMEVSGDGPTIHMGRAVANPDPPTWLAMNTDANKQIPHLTPREAKALRAKIRKLNSKGMALIEQINEIGRTLNDAGYPGEFEWDGFMGYKLVDPITDHLGSAKPIAASALKRPGKTRDFCRRVTATFGREPDGLLRWSEGMIAMFRRQGDLMPFYVDEGLEPSRAYEGCYNGPQD